ncbi:MAG: NAD(P)/FAD-dependent oxidoreductase [Halodesulfurarchaeum sp.]
MDVAVVGGGIVGLFSAYSLADRGADVTVFEQGPLGHGSTGRSAGGIRRQFSTPVNVELSKASRPVWTDFEDQFGTDIALRQNGYLFLARSAEMAETFEETVAMQHDHGVPTELLTPTEAVEVCPGLRSEPFRTATYLETDGFADPHLALQGVAETLRDMGVPIRTKTPVTDIQVADGAVRGISIPNGGHQVDHVVNAAGPWARSVAEMAGRDIPVAPKRRQVLVVEPERSVSEQVPLTIDLETGSYFRPEREGDALVGGHFGTDDADEDEDADPDGYAEKVSLEYAATALEHAADVASYFGPETRVKRGWAGLYAMTPDRHPIIDEPLPGFVTAVGFSGHGFQHAPATGKLVSELVLDGRSSLVDISRLDAGRFERGDLIEERHVA